MKVATYNKALAGALFSSLLLTACGGGGDGGSKPTVQPPTSGGAKPPVTTPEKPVVTAPEKPAVTAPVVPPVKTPEKPVVTTPEKPPVTAPVVPPNSNGSKSAIENRAGLAVDNFISMQRQACGIGGYTHDEKLADISNKHANYLAHVFSNTDARGINAHSEAAYSGVEAITGANNPFFTGVDLSERFSTAKYTKGGFSASENIVQRSEINVSSTPRAPEEVGMVMAKALLSAPYHLRGLVNPTLVRSGSSVTTHTPYGKDKSSAFGYTLVMSSASTTADKVVTPSGISTYPCGATTDTNTALYGESPDPTKGMNRNLSTDPIGHPVHIKMWSAKTIKVSNIKMVDVARNITIPVQLIDSNNDPYKNTYYELPDNEAFFMPITDSLNSCEKGVRKNCGLYGNSKYAVSFDVLADNKTLQTKSFTFSTGDVNY